MKAIEIDAITQFNLEHLIVRMMKVAGELANLRSTLANLDDSTIGYIHHLTTNYGGLIDDETLHDWEGRLRCASSDLSYRLDHDRLVIGRVGSFEELLEKSVKNRQKPLTNPHLVI